MNLRGHFNPSHGFRHVSRCLRKGEAIPPMPSLLEQLVACHAEMARLAQEEAATPEPNTDEWAEEIEDAA